MSADRPKRSWRTRLLLALASSLCAFALLEAGFRVSESIQRRRAGELWAVYDADLGYRNNPRFPGHSPEGFRDDPLAPKGDRFRVVVLGDSVAYYGEDAADTFPGRLEARLAADRPDERFDVVNTAVKGWTSWQETRFLEREVDALDPDLVVLTFVLNDCHRILHAFRVEDGEIVGQNYEFSEEAVASVDSWLYQTLRKSRFLVWLRHRFASLDAASLSGSDAYSFELRPDFRTAWLDESWPEIEAQLTGLKALATARGFDLLVLAVPFGDQYREDYLARDREYVLRPQRSLAGVCERVGIPLLDLYDRLDPALDIEADQVHLTAHGRERVAEALAATLEN